MPTTTRLSLRYPSTSDTADVPRDIGNLASDIDKAAIFSKGTFASRPTSTVGSPGIDGRYYFATDTSRLYLDTGTSWVEVASGSDSVTSAMIAANAVTDAKLGTALADNLGITNSGNTRRTTTGLVNTTQVTTTSTTWTDVANSSITFNATADAVVLISAQCDISSLVVGRAAFATLQHVGTSQYLGQFGSNITAVLDTYAFRSADPWLTQCNGWLGVFASGSNTVKMRFATDPFNAGTCYVKNVTVSAIVLDC